MLGRSVALAAAVACLAGGAARAATCTEGQGAATSTAFSKYQAAVGSACASDQCSYLCLSSQQDMAAALPDCVYTDGVNHREQLRGFIAACTGGGTPTYAPVAANASATGPSGATAATVYAPSAASMNWTYSGSSAPTAAPVTASWGSNSATPSPTTNAPTATGAAPTATPAVSSSGGGGANATAPANTSTCSKEEQDRVFSAYSSKESNLTAACADNECSSDCVAIHEQIVPNLPNCTSSDGTNYLTKMIASLLSCRAANSTGSSVGVGTCSVIDTNATRILYDQYQSKLRDECDSDKCSSGCLTLMNEMTTVLPDCVYTDGVNYHNESAGVVIACAMSAGGVPTPGQSSSATRPLPLAGGLVVVALMVAGRL